MIRTPKDPEIAVVGGGVGGLAVAVGLARQGVKPSVFEKDPSPDPSRGCGVQIAPNGVRALAALGLDSCLQGRALTPSHIDIHDIDRGKRLFRFQLNRPDDPHPHLHMHRGVLHAILQRAAQRLDIPIHRGRAILAACPRDDRIRLHSRNAPGRDVDFVIAADGARSQLRGKGRHRIVALDMRAFRRTLPLDEKRPPPDPSLWIGLRRHCVAYPILDPHGRLVLNIVLIQQRCARRRPVAPQLQPCLEGLDREKGYALFDCPSPPPRAQNRLALLGDAACPIPPFSAQGACLALEDAVLLSRLLSQAIRRQDPLDEAARLYARQRTPRLRQIRRLTRQNARLMHPRRKIVSLAQQTILAALGKISPQSVARRLNARNRILYGRTDPPPKADATSATASRM